ncbi:DUF4142 domain-containing protein [Puia sp. P3]|uniref:DUF4142 domain-containing protein n=1 Tax=Puia sp. P3 TaxID=3423952 RepID=UPI003D667FFE
MRRSGSRCLTIEPVCTARYFLIQASIGNLQEVAMGRLAADQGSDADVKAFGGPMVADHSKIEDELIQLVRKRGFQIPKGATEAPASNPMLKKMTGDCEFRKSKRYAICGG